MIDQVEVRRRRYYDSVRLMLASRAVAAVDGVAVALVAMATDLNLRLLTEMGFDPEAASGAGPDDLVFAVRAWDEEAVAAAGEALERTLAPPPARGSGDRWQAPAPRTVGTAANASGATIALVSVPGRYAFVEAMDALRAGMDVMLFSDNVPVEQEVLLKEEAARLGLIVMGPDCGTAIVAGVDLGFANAVHPGPVSIVGASGTGIQQLTCLLDDADIGIRHALGTGSRDLTEAVGGSSTLRALEALDSDPETEVLIVVSKPPAPRVAERVRAAARLCATPSVIAFVGQADTTLEGAANEAMRILGKPPPTPVSWLGPRRRHRPGVLRGYFSGGTLRDEARAIAESVLGPVSTAAGEAGHAMVDYGGDEFTLGRAHPMIDLRMRIDALEGVAADRDVGVILLDVVLGYGAHVDPAAELASVVMDATGQGAAVVVSMCGSSGDPQGRYRQAKAFRDAGASVFVSNAAAARRALELVTGGLR